jgi:2-deoxy-D-gluconate 3-dehydrogenase
VTVLDRFRLDGRRALVTGGSGGLGRAAAEALAGAGARVAVIGRSEMVHEVGAEVGAAAVRADLADRSELRRGFDEAVSALGGLEILVAAHGTNYVDDALEYSLEGWDSLLAVNLTSVFELCQLAGRVLVPQGKGKVITIASMLSFSGGLRVAGYAASKGGVAQLTKALANEWAPRGVNVNAIAPGYVKTALNRHIWRDDPDRDQAIVARIPAARWGEPADLQGAIVFLASSASDYVHGAVLPVDGGWLAR